MPKSLGQKLLISTITSSFNKIKPMLTLPGKLSFDLSQITDVDSAGIAFLIELKATGKVTFTNPSTQINNLCQLYKVTL